MKIARYTIPFFLLLTQLSAQSAVIRGRVFDQKNNGPADNRYHGGFLIGTHALPIGKGSQEKVPALHVLR